MILWYFALCLVLLFYMSVDLRQYFVQTTSVGCFFNFVESEYQLLSGSIICLRSQGSDGISRTRLEKNSILALADAKAAGMTIFVVI